MKVLVLAVAGLLSLNAAASGHAQCKAPTKKGQKSSQSCSHKTAHKKASKTKHASVAAVATTAAVAVVPGQAALQSEAPSNPRSVCLTALASSKASQHIAAKAPFFLDRAPSPAVLADKSRPSKAERSELTSVIAGYELCLDMSSEWLKQTYPPEVVSMLDAKWQDTKSILNELQAGKLSYGDAAKAVAETEVAYQAKVDNRF